MVHPKWWRPGP